MPITRGFRPHERLHEHLHEHVRQSRFFPIGLSDRSMAVRPLSAVQGEKAMLDMLCCQMVAHMIRAGYFLLIADFCRQAWASFCRAGAMAGRGWRKAAPGIAARQSFAAGMSG